VLKTAFAAAALATALSLGATADKAAAIPSAPPTQLGFATADNGLVQKTAVGPWGCRRVVRGARVWVGPRRPLYGFARPGWGWSSPAWGWGWGRPGWGRPGWGW